MGREGVAQGSDAPPCGFDGSLCGFAQEVLELGADLLDQIEIGTVGRQEQQVCAPVPDRGPDGGSLVAREVVHDDDVARLLRRTELQFDPRGKAGGADRLIELESPA